MPAPVVTRLAPTPSGYLHLGNAWNFALTWLIARHLGGRVWLRIDDLDAERFRPEYLQDVFDCLDWLGLDWDAGPRNAAAFRSGSMGQTHRLNRYREALEKLQGLNRVGMAQPTRGGKEPVLYACSCSRKAIRAMARDSVAAQRSGESGEDGIIPDTAADLLYPGTCRCRGISLDAPGVAWRLRTSRDKPVRIRELRTGPRTVDLAGVLGDFVVRSRTGRPAYQVASLCDDVDMGVNCVVRGEDLLPSTAGQMRLAQVLGYRAFQNAVFCHHSLVVAPSGEKLSKSLGAHSLRALRSRLGNSGPVWSFFASRLGMGGGPRSAGQVLDAFSPPAIAEAPLRWEDFTLALASH